MSEGRDLEWVRITDWAKYSWLRHGFSTRNGGFSEMYAGGGEPELNLGLTREDAPETVETNRRRATEDLAGVAARLVTVRQVHGTKVLLAEQEGRAGDADGLVTRRSGLVLGVMAADCVPILIADVRLRIVGAFHAGWRGTAAGMAGVGVGEMLALGAQREDLVAAVGPSIGACCYEVGDEVRTAFQARLEGVEGIIRGATVDLWESNRRQLDAEGVQRVSVVGECTACMRRADGRRKYFSHRAEAGVTGRMMGMIAVV